MRKTRNGFDRHAKTGGEKKRMLDLSTKSNVAITRGLSPRLSSLSANADAPIIGPIETSRGDAETEGSPPATPIVPEAPTRDIRRNGDETDYRMAKIEEILVHAAMPLLEKSALLAEWLCHAETTLSVPGQLVEEPTGGRPEGALTRAARTLRVPGKTLKARRKFIERALKIDSIWGDAKSAARAAGLDNIQSVLLEIADERSSPGAQLAKVKEIAARRAAPRQTANVATEPEKTGGVTPQMQDAIGSPELVPTSVETMTVEEEAHLAKMRASWGDQNLLLRKEWDRASPVVQLCFIRENMRGMQIREPAEVLQDEANSRSRGSAAETLAAIVAGQSEIAESKPETPNSARAQ